MSTALIPVAPSETVISNGFARARVRADFLSHLIAMRSQAPQTRLRRRAEPEQATIAYAATGRLPQPAGQTLSRSL
jgi:hypothetical protein